MGCQFSRELVVNQDSTTQEAEQDNGDPGEITAPPHEPEAAASRTYDLSKDLAVDVSIPKDKMARVRNGHEAALKLVKTIQFDAGCQDESVIPLSSLVKLVRRDFQELSIDDIADVFIRHMKLNLYLEALPGEHQSAASKLPYSNVVVPIQKLTIMLARLPCFQGPSRPASQFMSWHTKLKFCRLCQTKTGALRRSTTFAVLPIKAEPPGILIPKKLPPLNLAPGAPLHNQLKGESPLASHFNIKLKNGF